MSLIPGWTNVSSLVLRLVLFAGAALCALFPGSAWAGVIHVKADATGANNGHSWADAYTGLQAALAAAETPTPLIIPAALINLATVPQLGTGVVHWGESWSKANFNVLNKSQLGMLDKTSGSYDQWAKYRTEGQLLFNTTWQSGVGKDIYDASNPTRRFPASAPASGKYETGFEQFIPAGALQWPDLASKYDDFKDFALQFSRYYTTDAAGNVYKGPVKDAAHLVVFNTEFGEADRVNTPYDFVFIDTFDGNRPAADGSNLATLLNSGTGIGMKGIFYICANFDQTGAGNPASLPNAQKPDDSVVSLAQVYLDGVLYTAGTIHFGGNPVIYGSVVSQKGYLPGGTPNVYYNHNLGTGIYLPSFVRLTFEAGPGGSVSADDGLTTAGSLDQGVHKGYDASAVLAVADRGFHFTQWVRSGDGATTTSNPLTVQSAAEDTTLTATFVVNPHYTLTYTAGANGSISGTTPQTVDYGTSGTAVEAVPNVGYHFVQWSDASTANSRTDTNVTTDVTVTATFAINTYTLTYSAGPGGSITGTTPQTVNHGASGTAVTAVAATGYHFLKWSDNVMTASRTDTSVTGNINVVAVFASPEGAIHCVKADATGANNGQSWTDAYTDLQAALAAAEWGDEIWVAQGTYKPTSGAEQTVSFVLEAGVGLYGGFAGTESERGQRDWNANATILSGDIGTVGSAADNSYHVVIGAHLAVLDGFTITGGNANGSGYRDGGGMYNWSSSPTVTNCTFSGNTARAGGGMYNDNSSPSVTNCAFSGNTASGGDGGGMYNAGGSPDVTNCAFSGNTASSGDGGGMYNGGGSPTVTNCTFSGNTAYYGGGMHSKDCSPTVVNSTFSDNTAKDGGAMYSSGGLPTVANCTFSGNMAGASGNYNRYGGGMYNENCSPTVTNCTFSDNTAYSTYYSYGGGMYNWGSSPDVTNCTFSGNMAYSGGGIYNGGSSLTVTNCIFSGNTAGGDGGGMCKSGSSSPVTNCTFSGNTAGYGGGGIYNSDSSPVTNCTFSGNTAVNGGGMYDEDSSPAMTNCVFWDNTAPLGAEIYKYSGTPTFSHCDIRGSGGSGALWDTALGADGGGNTMANPRFVAPATPAGPDGLWRTRDDGLRLRSDSPCIGAADPAAAPETDILGLRRKTAPDIGAYEFDWTRTSTGPAWLLFR